MQPGAQPANFQIKSERMPAVTSAAVYNRSVSESASITALRQQQPVMRQHPSMVSACMVSTE